MVSSPQPSSFGSFGPSSFGLLYSFVSDLTCDVHQDQFLERVGVEKPTCAIIFYEYVWESEEEFGVKDDLLLSAPHPLYPNIFHGSAISILSCETLFRNFSTSDHLQNTWDASISFDYGEDKYFFLDPPNLSSYFSKNTEGEISHFSSSPLYDSSDH